MLLADLGARVFVAAVAGVTGVVVVHMAGVAGRLVVLVQEEVPVVVEGGRRPALLGVALTAVARDLTVQAVPGAAVAALAALADSGLQKVVGEAADGVEGLHPLVVAVAGDAVLLDQVLVEGDELLLVADGHALGGDQSDVRGLVTLGAELRTAAPEGAVAGEAVRLQGAVGLHELAGGDHQVRQEDSQEQQHDQVRADDVSDGFLVHCHCQKRKMLRMCASPRTAKARVMGKCTARHCFIMSRVTASQKTSRSTASPASPCSA